MEGAGQEGWQAGGSPGAPSLVELGLQRGECLIPACRDVDFHHPWKQINSQGKWKR